MKDFEQNEYQVMLEQSNKLIQRLHVQHRQEKQDILNQFDEFRKNSQQRLMNISAVYGNSLLRVLHGSSILNPIEYIPHAEAQLIIASFKQEQQLQIRQIQEQCYQEIQAVKGQLQLSQYGVSEDMHQDQRYQQQQNIPVNITEFLHQFNRDSISNDIKLAPSLPIILSLENSLKILQHRHDILLNKIQNDDTEIRLKKKYNKIIEEKQLQYTNQFNMLQKEFSRFKENQKIQQDIIKKQLTTKQQEVVQLQNNYTSEQDQIQSYKDEIVRLDQQNKKHELSLKRLRNEITQEITGLQFVDQHKSVGKLQAEIIYLKGFESVYIQTEQDMIRKMIDLEKTLESTRNKNKLLHQEIMELTKDAESKVVGRFQHIIDQQLFQINSINQEFQLESQKIIDLQHDNKQLSHEINQYITQIRDNDVFINSLRDDLRISINDYQNAQRQVDFLVRRSSSLVSEKQVLKLNINELILKNEDLVQHLNLKQVYYQTQEVNLRKNLVEKLGSVYGENANTKAKIISDQIFEQSKPSTFSEETQKLIASENKQFATEIKKQNIELNDFEKGIEQHCLILDEVVQVNIKAIQTEFSSTEEKGCYVYPAQLNDLKEFQQQVYFSADDNIVVSQYVEQVNTLSQELESYKIKDIDTKTFRQDMYQELYKEQIDMVNSQKFQQLMMYEDIYSQTSRYNLLFIQASQHQCKEFHEFVDEILYIQNQKDTKYLAIINKMKQQKTADEAELVQSLQVSQQKYNELYMNYNKLKNSILFIQQSVTSQQQPILDQMVVELQKRVNNLQNSLKLVSKSVMDRLFVQKQDCAVQLNYESINASVLTLQVEFLDQEMETDIIHSYYKLLQTDPIESIIIERALTPPIIQTENINLQTEAIVYIPSFEIQQQLITNQTNMIDFECQIAIKEYQILTENKQVTRSVTVLPILDIQNSNEVSIQQAEKYPLAMMQDFEVQVEFILEQKSQPHVLTEQSNLNIPSNLTQQQIDQILNILPKQPSQISQHSQTNFLGFDIKLQTDDFTQINKQRQKEAFSILTQLETLIIRENNSPTYTEKNCDFDYGLIEEQLNDIKLSQLKQCKHVRTQTIPVENLQLEDFISKYIRIQKQQIDFKDKYEKNCSEMETASQQIQEAKKSELSIRTLYNDLNEDYKIQSVNLKQAQTQAIQYENWYNKALSENSKLIKEKPLTNSKAAKTLAVLKTKQQEREEYELRQLMNIGMEIANQFDKGEDKETQIELRISRVDQIDVENHGEVKYKSRARSKVQQNKE
ncbi:hypothetical protein SS50377_23158 [Spironucleus salmonicida]|uniref:Uncharacterized protein n=1 Tax=Spironucleus salmonicida TaxID=348837 RepID=V6LBU1_9EUKA|nr:hypothetical protein SS50377_23158 [Spironucleus salmonicida]|eukprot:EST41668.1 Hypothetical protein SS50377_18756 [Spironucleus salmonicida]